jgi:acyl-CoA thioester hydrolase
MSRHRLAVHFPRLPSDPPPLVARIARRVHFREADVMGIAWYGRYAAFFEEAAAELRQRCGLSHQDLFRAGLQAPVARFYVEYLRPLHLDDTVTVTARLVWNAGARLDIEYEIAKDGGERATTGYTVQLLTDAATARVCIAPPALLEECHRKWKHGEFRHLQ